MNTTAKHQTAGLEKGIYWSWTRLRGWRLNAKAYNLHHTSGGRAFGWYMGHPGGGVTHTFCQEAENGDHRHDNGGDEDDK